MTIKVLLADDHEIMRQGISALLSKHRKFEVVGQASDGLQVLKMVPQLNPDIVIMDIGMPNLNGIGATEKLMLIAPSLKIMALSIHSERSIVVKMIQAGAAGYMHKDSAFDELAEGLNAILEGRTFLCNKIARIVFSEHLGLVSKPETINGDQLTMREKEVLQLVAEGKTTRTIAQMLNISKKTVDTHREHIMEKLNIRNIAGLTKYAIREGLTSPNQ